MAEFIRHAAHRLAHRYTFAAGFIVLIVFCGFVFLLMQFHRMETANDLFESGYYKQRALTQRIAFLASEITIDPTKADATPSARLLRETWLRLRSVHEQFTKNPTNKKVIKLRQDFPEETHQLDEALSAYIAAARNLDQTFDRGDFAALNHDNPDLKYIVEQASGPLPQLLEDDVGRIREHVEGDFNHFAMTLSILMSLILIALFAEIKFIFLPMAHDIKETMTELDNKRLQAEQADRLKSEFLATMSHEIRSPMSGVLGMAELLVQTPLTHSQRGYVSTIVNSGEALFRIIEDILDFSKLESDRMQLNTQPMNMLDLVDDICSLYASKAREKALEIAAHYKPGSEQFVYADSGRMRQILGNLVNNAIKFTDIGHILISVTEDKTRDDAANTAWLTFAVQDTGIGISADFQMQAFDKFSQYDGSSTRSYGGMGLGLSVCRRLVEMMGGVIELDSTVGLGSTFKFTLPLKRNHSETQVIARPPVLKDLRILAVDDLACIRTVLKEQLDEAGARCDTAAGGEAALRMMRDAERMQDPYQIVLIDYLMPGMNGESLARAINDEAGLRDACLIMVTAAGETMGHETFEKSGFSALIPKPLKNRVLIETLAIIWHRYQQGDREGLIVVDDIRQAAGQDDEQSIQAKNARVLLAEDSRVNQLFAQEILEQMGCVITIAANGQEAVTMLRDRPFELVLMDCQMPIMDGFEATRIIRSLRDHPALSDIPIIALTANAMDGDREKCLAAGMTDYISKPVRARELKEKVHYWVQVATSGGHAADQPAAQSVSVETDTGDLIDQSAVDEARRVLKDKYPETMMQFIHDVTAYIAEMEMAMAGNDANGMVRPAHTVKSTSRLMGAARLAVVALDLEKTARAPHSTDIAEMRRKFAALVETFDETRREMEKLSA